MADNNMMELADKYRELRDKKSEMEFEVKQVNEELQIVERDLIGAMTDNECDGFKHNGKNFVMMTKEYPSAVVERKAELYDVMKEQGFEHLFTINSNTLSATIKELKGCNDDELPEWLRGLVKNTEKVSIQLRKA